MCKGGRANGTCVLEFQGGGEDRESCSLPVSGEHDRDVVLSLRICVLASVNVMLLADPLNLRAPARAAPPET